MREPPPVDAVAIADAVRAGRYSATEVLEACLAAIDTQNPALNAFVAVHADSARVAARRIDRAVRKNLDPGPLAGVPFGVKDLEDCTGMVTSHGSLLYKHSPPAVADSLHVGRLRAAGAVPVGKTATPEFGMDSSTTSRGWGYTPNPKRLDATPGGSSGGSAAAVAGGLVPLATASDGGGSVRTPAAFCGLVGLKTSMGRIPKARTSLTGLSCPASLVQTVRDCARHLDVACGPDLRDRQSLPRPRSSYEAALDVLDIKGLRAAWSADLGFAPVESSVVAIAEEAARQLVADAALTWVTSQRVAFPDVVETWVRVILAELWTAFEPGVWPDRADEFGAEVRWFLQSHPPPSYDEVVAAHERRERIQAQSAALFDEVDVVLTPTVAVDGFNAEGPLPREVLGVPTPYGPELFTMWANLTGQPAISVPAGVADGLPIGLQIVANPHREDVLLRLARILEMRRPWKTTPVPGIPAL
jgi:aspartyl-tRNA(Asn)/glutamyl-tRNA(Gln) amidotransferase subunit A